MPEAGQVGTLIAAQKHRDYTCFSVQSRSGLVLILSLLPFLHSRSVPQKLDCATGTQGQT
jgi:hypothetical protein